MDDRNDDALMAQLDADDPGHVHAGAEGEPKGSRYEPATAGQPMNPDR
jgi:hypothetical protein